jgi:hypothetical protein
VRTTGSVRRFVAMIQDAFDTPFEARLVDGEIVITGPGGFNGSMTQQAARGSLKSLQGALQTAEEPEGVYQKPLG